jgi:hypothetical protein
VVLSRRPPSLPDADRTTAARYASLISIHFIFQLVYLSLLYVGIGLTQVKGLMDGNPSGVSTGLLILLVVMLLVVVPMSVLRIRRARRYAAAHADLLTAV